MLKNTFVIIVSYILLTLLASCEQRSETIDEKKSLKAVEQTKQRVAANESLTVEQATNNISAMDKISPNVLASLDILADYDRELSYGPDKWDEELWAWKVLLKWDQECDYGPSVHEYQLDPSEYTFVTVRCALGAYQPLFYIYLLDKKKKESVQLKLGRSRDSTELFNEVSGDVLINKDTKELSILSVSRGSKDCGTYRKFNFVEGDSVKSSNFVVKSTRIQECLNNPVEVKRIPYELSDYKNWPIVDE